MGDAEPAREGFIILFDRPVRADAEARVGGDRPAVAEIDGAAMVAEGFVDWKHSGSGAVMALGAAGDGVGDYRSRRTGGGIRIVDRRDEILPPRPAGGAVRRRAGQAVEGDLRRQHVAIQAVAGQRHHRLDGADAVAAFVIIKDGGVDRGRAEFERRTVIGVAEFRGAARIVGAALGRRPGCRQQVGSEDAERGTDAGGCAGQLHPQPPPSKLRPPAAASLLK